MADTSQAERERLERTRSFDQVAELYDTYLAVLWLARKAPPPL